MGQVELSFVVPAYNEENFIEHTLLTIDQLIRTKGLPYEIIVVDDGSQDATLTKAAKYAKDNCHVKVVTCPRNSGKGHAEKTGFMHADGQIVIFADSDLEIDLGKVSEYLEALKKGDIVIASKSHPESHVQVPFSRKVMSYCFNRLVQLLTGVPLKDTQSGLKAMKRNAFENIFPRLAVKRYAFDVELLAVANLYGLNIVEMPVNIKLNASFSARQIWRMLLDLLGIAYRLRLIRWYQRRLPDKNRLQKLVNRVFREA